MHHRSESPCFLAGFHGLCESFSVWHWFAPEEQRFHQGIGEDFVAGVFSSLMIICKEKQRQKGCACKFKQIPQKNKLLQVSEAYIKMVTCWGGLQSAFIGARVTQICSCGSEELGCYPKFWFQNFPYLNFCPKPNSLRKVKCKEFSIGVYCVPCYIMGIKGEFQKQAR